MKIISLHITNGPNWPPLLEFLNTHKSSTDVFCFQEIYPGELKTTLTGFAAFYTTGVATFIRNEFVVENYQTVRTQVGGQASVGGGVTQAKDLPIFDITKQEKKFRIINVFGLTEHITEVINRSTYPVIVVGDFGPDAAAVIASSLATTDLIDLVAEYGLATARGGSPTEPARVIDNVFASPKLKVKGFSVPNLAISDHLPLIFETK